jgi:hypothetical protein
MHCHFHCKDICLTRSFTIPHTVYGSMPYCCPPFTKRSVHVAPQSPTRLGTASEMAANETITLSISDDIDDFCGICMKDFLAPKILSCFHSFCSKCLLNYVAKTGRHSGDAFPCPLCFADIALPPNGVEGLQDNLYIKASRARSAKAANTPCEVCENGLRGANRCLECDQSMCPSCCKTHLKMNASRNHHLVSLSERGTSRMTASSFCDKHSHSELSFYCQKCEMSICLKCKLTTHENHPSADLVEFANETRVRLTSMLEETASGLSSLHQGMADVNTYEENTREMKTRVVQAISRRTETLHQELTTLSQTVMEDMTTEYEIEAARLSAHKTNIGKKAKALTTQIHAAKQMVCYGSDADLAGRKLDLERRLTDIGRASTPRSLSQLEVVFKGGDADGFRLVDVFGRLSKRRSTQKNAEVTIS